MIIEWLPMIIGVAIFLNLWTKSTLGAKPKPTTKSKKKKMYLVVEE